MPKHSRGAFDRRRPGQPDGADDVINRYGTYEVQQTADTDNTFPMIAQGLPRSMAGKAVTQHAMHMEDQAEKKKTR